jgi:hypothetical protein
MKFIKKLRIGSFVLGVFTILLSLSPAHALLSDADALSLIEATTPTAATNVAEAGTFWSAQNPDSAPSPADMINVPA